MTFQDPLFPYSTSGNTNYVLTVREIVTEAFDVLQMGVEGETLTDDMYDRGTKSLNLLLQSMQGDDLHLSTQHDASLFLVGGQGEYDLDSANITNSYNSDTLAADAATTDTTITLDDAGDVVDGDIIGIYLDDNSIQWTTVSGTPAGDVVTLADALTGDATAGNYVFFYNGTFKAISKTLDFRRVDGWINESPMDYVPRKDFYALPDKTAQGIPTQVYYNRYQNTVHLYPIPQDSSCIIKFNYEKMLDSAVAPDDLLEFAPYYYEALVYGLAKRLILKYRVPREIAEMVVIMADESYNKALTYDDEQGDIQFMPAQQ